MKIKEVRQKEKTIFNQVAMHPLQSWEWGDFRREWGNEVIRLGVYDNGKLQESLQLTLHKVPGISKKVGMLIKGPKPTKEMLEQLKIFAKENNLIFIKMEPNHPFIRRADGVQENEVPPKNNPSTRTSHNEVKDAKNMLKTNGAVHGKTLFTPTTFWIDLTLNKEEMMKGFHSKTRYNIRYAKRKGVEVFEDNSDEMFEEYIKLMKITTDRQNFYAHTEKYHRLMWKHLNKKLLEENKLPIARLLVARKGKEVLTTWIIFVWHEFLYYPYGASSFKKKNLQANSRIMWEAILFGKKLGLKNFDLWGREPGKGFTKFKEGFNPHIVEFLGTWDIPTSHLYYPFRFADFIRWKYLRFRKSLSGTDDGF